MIALIGQSVIDRVRQPDGAVTERLGGAPFYAAQALVASNYRDVGIATRGAGDQLRAALDGYGLRIVAGPASRTFVSEFELSASGEHRHAIAALGEPFTPADITGWAAPILDHASAVIVGTQWRGDFPAATLQAITTPQRRVLLDAQGPARPARLGPIRLDGPFEPGLVTGVYAVKLTDAEAEVLIGRLHPDLPAVIGVSVVVVTHGAAGATVISDGRISQVDAPRVTGLADTIGAGDAFLGLFGAALDDQLGPVEAAACACAATSRFLHRRQTQP